MQSEQPKETTPQIDLGRVGTGINTQKQDLESIDTAFFPGDELVEIFLDTEAIISNPVYNILDAKQGESKLKAGLEGVKDFATYPARRFQSRFDTKKEEPENPKDWFDVYRDFTDLPPWAATMGGLGMSILTDPKDFLTAGMTSLGKLSLKTGKNIAKNVDDIFESTNDISKVADYLKNQTDIEEGSKVFNDILNAKQAGKTLTQAGSRVEQAAEGQKALINLDIPFTDINKPLVSGEGVFGKIDDFEEWTKTNPVMKDARKAFIPKPDDISDSAWDIYRKNTHAGKYFARENAIRPGKEYSNVLDNVLEGTDVSKQDFSDIIEVPGKYDNIPDEVRNLIDKKHIKTNREIIEAQKAMGLKTSEIEKYYPRTLTPEARQALDAGNYTYSDSAIKADPHQFGRTERFRELTTKQANELAREGKLDDLLGKDFNKNIFIDDPAIAQTYRNLIHENKMNNARMINELVEDGLKEGYVVKADGDIPKGFKKIDNPGDYENLVEGYAFKEPEAKLIEGNIKQKVPEEFEHIMGLWKKGMKGWKTGNLLFGGSWYGKNALGNTYRMLQNGFSTPSSLPQSFDMVKKISKNEPINKTIKTARGKIELDDFVEAMKKRGVLDQGLYADIEKELSESMSQTGIINWLTEKGFGIHKFEEDLTRLAMSLDAVKKGYNFDEAAKISNETLFEYDLLTDKERGIKNALMPFYTYHRKNIPYQIIKNIQNPRVPNILRDIRKAANEYSAQTSDDDRYIPENVRNSAPIRVGDSTIPLANILSQYELMNIAKDPAQYAFQNINPLIQILGNEVYGKNYYTGQEQNLLENIAGSWKPSKFVMDIIESATDEEGEPFTSSPPEEITDLINPFYSYNPTEKEADIIKNMELQDLLDKVSKKKRNYRDSGSRVQKLLLEYYKDKLNRLR